MTQICGFNPFLTFVFFVEVFGCDCRGDALNGFLTVSHKFFKTSKEIICQRLGGRVDEALANLRKLTANSSFRDVC